MCATNSTGPGKRASLSRARARPGAQSKTRSRTARLTHVRTHLRRAPHPTSAHHLKLLATFVLFFWHHHIKHPSHPHHTSVAPRLSRARARTCVCRRRGDLCVEISRRWREVRHRGDASLTTMTRERTVEQTDGSRRSLVVREAPPAVDNAPLLFKNN